MKSKKIFGRIFSLLVVLTILAFSCINAFAAGINSYEQSVLAQMRTPANMNGNMVYVPDSYVNQAEAQFNTIEMTSQQASEINSIISQGRSFLEGTGKSSMKELTPAEKRQILSYASAAAGVLNLTAAAGSDASQVKIMDSDGNVIVDESGAVIKTTGSQTTAGYVPTVFAASLAVLTVLACAGIVCGKVSKKR